MDKKLTRVNMNTFKTNTHNSGHICPGHICPNENNLILVDLSYDFDDDAFSINSYDSDQMLSLSYDQEGPSKSKHFDEMSEDDEYEEEDDEFDYWSAEDRERARERARDALQLEGLAEALEGKLNWTSTLDNSFDPSISLNSSVDTSEFPGLNDSMQSVSSSSSRSSTNRKPRRKSSKSSPGPSPKRRVFRPARHIDIIVGPETSIEFFKPQETGRAKGAKRNSARPLRVEGARSPPACRIYRASLASPQNPACPYGENCKFSHSVTPRGGPKKHERGPQNNYKLRRVTEPGIKKKPECRFGNQCNNKKCTFVHAFDPALDPAFDSPAQDEIKDGGNSKPASEEGEGSQKFKKMWLCKNMFRVTSDKIEKIDKCKFGNNCAFAHSKEEVRQVLTECKFGAECNLVQLNFVSVNNVKVRRYTNNGEKKCFKLHPKERIIDYIKRTTAHS